MGLPFRVLYSPEFPLGLINYDKTPKPDRTQFRLALARDIEARGLINPLIVLNHPRPKCPDMWLMVGQNRLWALNHLGYLRAPVVITGFSPVPAKEIGSWEELRGLFRDGEPYRSAYGIAIRGNTPPEDYGTRL